MGIFTTPPSPFSTIHQPFGNNTFLNFETLRILSTTPYGGCDPAEYLTAIASINPRDPETWAIAWSHAAKMAETHAEEALRQGDRTAARDAFLRASSYTRASGYLRINGPTLELHDPRSLPTARKVQSLFQRALPLLDCEAKVVSIPYRTSPSPSSETETIPLPGYLYIPSPQNRHDDGKIPLLINVGGADSVQEELYYIHPQAGHVRGYAVLTFEGPGQGVVLREHGLHMRHDFEAVVGQVLDWLETYTQSLKSEEGISLDLTRIAVAGASMGGYFALRAASDSRIKACISIDPFYDMWDFGTRHMPQPVMKAWMSGWLSDSVVDRLMGFGSYLDLTMRWEIGLAGALFGISEPSKMLKEMKKYSLVHGYLEGVKCPVFVSGAGKSLYFDTEEHTMRVFGDLGHLGERGREVWVPTRPEEGALQAKIGAWGLLNQRVFGFLDGVFGVERGVVE